MPAQAKGNSIGGPAGPTIAIIGTEGSGKTVFTAVLARHLLHPAPGKPNSARVILNPQNVATMRYVDNVWQTLLDGEWPPSTPPGELFELKWKFEVDGGKTSSQVRLIDAAGQDLRQLFGEEKVLQERGLPESLQKLAEYCRSADIVLFLVNLKDFEGQADPRRRTDNEAAIKSAMDYLSADGRQRHFCMVFTQVDLYHDAARRSGGWPELAKQMVPYISNAYLQPATVPESRRVPTYAVSAVNKTRVIVDDRGVPRRMPDPSFESEGLDDVVTWMTTRVREFRPPVESPPPSPVKPPQPTPVIPPPPTEVPRSPEWARSWWAFAVAGAIILGMLRSCAESPSPSKPTAPIPTVTGANWRKNPGIFDDSVTSYGTVRNDGAAGNVVVTSWVIENGKEVDRRSQDLFLNTGQSAEFRIELPGIYSVRNPHEVNTSVRVP